jgi:hypothetical protein
MELRPERRLAAKLAGHLADEPFLRAAPFPIGLTIATLTLVLRSRFILGHGYRYFSCPQ